MGWMPFLPRPSRSRYLRPWVILSCFLMLLLAVVGCGQVSGVLGAGATPSPTLTLKQAAMATMAAQGTALASEPHAPKHPETPPASCPEPASTPEIVPDVSLPTQGYADANLDNSTTAVTPPDQPLYVYVIMAGNRKSNPKQGLFIVSRLMRDPCASPAPNGGEASTYYNTPFQQGHVQMTGVAGDTVTFTTADGGGIVHRFDFVTGQFL
jgi:hypothetical protein